MNQLKNNGQINVPLLALAGIIGIIAFLLITRSFNFRSPLLSSLYNKTPSQAFDKIQIPPQDPAKVPTSNWTENWKGPPYLADWTQSNFDCSVAVLENNLTLNCNKGTLISKTAFNKDSSIIITGNINARENSNAEIGLIGESGTLAKLTTGESGEADYQIPSYQPNTDQTFRVVSSTINNELFVYYYLGENSEPIKKGPLQASSNLNVILSCQGICTYGPLIVSGIPTN